MPRSLRSHVKPRSSRPGFSYEVAEEHACRLLHVGDDFAKTDIDGVL
jgi:hypothetical protein